MKITAILIASAILIGPVHAGNDKKPTDLSVILSDPRAADHKSCVSTFSNMVILSEMQKHLDAKELVRDPAVMKLMREMLDESNACAAELGYD
jgi:hypothetical protein